MIQFKISFKCLLGIFCLSACGFFSSNPASILLTASGSDVHLKWNAGKSVLLMASEINSELSLPELNVNYTADPEFGKGSKIGQAYVVYKGTENSVVVTGLQAGKKYHFTVFEINENGFYLGNEALQIQEQVLEGSAKFEPMYAAAVVTCVCPALAGITCSVTGTTNTGTSVASAGACPHVGYCDGPGTNNPWTSLSGSGVVQYMFSAPVSAATLRANSVNTNDYATVSASGGAGGALSISGAVCMNFSGLVIGPLNTAGYGGVRWNVNSTGSYTRVTLTNTGAQSGWVAVCPTAITAALPIELVSLTAVCGDKKIILNWRTMSEKNNSCFEIERSFDAKTWEKIGKQAGAGNSTRTIDYSFEDLNIQDAGAYYRLKQIDFDGEFKYSEAVYTQNCRSHEAINIFPNPASGQVFISAKEVLTLEISDVYGRPLATQKIQTGENAVDISRLDKGTYIFRLSSETTLLKFSRLIVGD